MLVLSLRQPWAFLVVHRGKTIENRTRNTSFRGRFLIHAAKGMKVEEYEDAIAFAHEVDGTICVPPRAELQFGGIVGRAGLVDVIPPCRVEKVDHGGGIRSIAPCPHPWHMPDQYGYVLADIEPLPFRPLVGALGFFDEHHQRDRDIWQARLAGETVAELGERYDLRQEKIQQICVVGQAKAQRKKEQQERKAAR